MLDTTAKPLKKNQCAKRQYFAAFVVNLYIVAFGILEGWSSPMNILLTSDDTPLPSGKITMEEASWVTSLLSIGALMCNIVFGYITNNFGRKLPMLMITIPTIISWLLVWFAKNPFYLYASRLIGGSFGGACYMVIPMFLSEITDDSIRGRFLSALYTIENLGILLAYIIGNYFDYYAMPLFSIILTAIFAFFLLFIPESPIFLMRQNKVDKAKQSICYYKNIRATDKDSDHMLELEIDKLKCTLLVNSENVNNNSNKNWTPETTKIARKAMTTGIVLVVLYIYSGITPMTFYTANIFKETGSNLSPNMSAIVIGVIQVIGTWIATELVERVGRKILIVVSCFGTALSLIVMGVYMMLKTWNIPVEMVNWVPLASYSAATFISAIGIQTLTLTVVYEIAPEKIKETYMSFLMTLMWVLNFTSTKYLPTFLEVLGFHGSMYLFAGVCILSAIYIMIFMPETKGKTYEQIMNALASKSTVRVQNST